MESSRPSSPMRFDSPPQRAMSPKPCLSSPSAATYTACSTGLVASRSVASTWHSAYSATLGSRSTPSDPLKSRTPEHANRPSKLAFNLHPLAGKLKTLPIDFDAQLEELTYIEPSKPDACPPPLLLFGDAATNMALDLALLETIPANKPSSATTAGRPPASPSATASDTARSAQQHQTAPTSAVAPQEAESSITATTGPTP